MARHYEFTFYLRKTRSFNTQAAPRSGHDRRRMRRAVRLINRAAAIVARHSGEAAPFVVVGFREVR